MSHSSTDTNNEATNVPPRRTAFAHLASLGAASLVGSAFLGSRTAKGQTPATPSLDVQFFAFVKTIEGWWNTTKDMANRWDGYLKTANEVMSTLEKGKKFIGSLTNPQENIFLLQKKELEDYVQNFIKKDSDWTKTRFRLFNIESKILVRYVMSTSADYKRVYASLKRQWDMANAKNPNAPQGKDADKEFIKNHAGARVVVNASHNHHRGAMSSLKTQALKDNHRALVSDLERFQGAKRSEAYGTGATVIQTNALLALCDKLDQTNHILNQLLLASANTTLPTPEEAALAGEQSYKDSLKDIEKGEDYRLPIAGVASRFSPTPTSRRVGTLRRRLKGAQMDGEERMTT